MRSWTKYFLFLFCTIMVLEILKRAGENIMSS